MEVLSAVSWAALGVAGTLVSALVAERVGWVQISIMREAHALNVSKATPQIGCTIGVGFQQISPAGFNPHAFITVEIYNEGELAARDLQGEWILRAPTFGKALFPIQRDFLGKCEKHTHTYKINESGNWPPHSVPIEVDIEFYYTLPGTPDREQYNATYRYDTDSRQMLRIVSTKPIHSN
jgi:hypothetical protein